MREKQKLEAVKHCVYSSCGGAGGAGGAGVCVCVFWGGGGGGGRLGVN